MKIGIITFHASFNYGSMLQAYALHKVLSDMGHNVEIINFRSAAQKLMYHHPINFTSSEWSKPYLLMHYLKHISKYLPQIKKWNKYNTFLNKYLVHTKEFRTIEELKNQNFQYDFLVLGSDQIWNTKCRDFSEVFWGNFCNEKVKKIAYAPSMGKNPESLDAIFFKKSLSNFCAVSVRESRTKTVLINNNIFTNVSLTLDPTLLLKPSDYYVFAGNKPLIKGDYIYFYDPFVRPIFLKMALLIGKEKGFKVVVDRTYPASAFRDFDNILFNIEVGPKEFLNLIKYSKIVVAHSLHAVIFSVIFNKDFYALDGDKDSRLNFILNVLGLEKRAVSIDDQIMHEKTSIDYWDSIYQKYELLKKYSFTFIQEALLF